MSSQINSVSVPVRQLASEPYLHVLCYPSSDIDEASRRVEELRRLNVIQVIFEGRTKIGSLGLLGKGCVSLVVKADTGRRLYVLKIRRTDANRPSMHREAELQRLANKVSVGPKLHSVSDNFILMDMAEGDSIISWIRGLKGSGSTARLRGVLEEVLNQCYKLDQSGLDHGELSNLEKHVYVGQKVIILDFETASVNRRVSNVTSSLQNLFIGGSQAKKVRRMLRLKDIHLIIKAVRQYKEERNIQRFEGLLHELNLL